MEYRVATLEDLDLLTTSRIEVLRAANKLDDSVDMTLVEKESYKYYKKALADGTHFAILVMDDGKVGGFGTHEELLETNSVYRQIYELQNGGRGRQFLHCNADLPQSRWKKGLYYEYVYESEL